jgi:hypothetical protein
LELLFKLLFVDDVVLLDFFVPAVLRFKPLFLAVLCLDIFLRLCVFLAVSVTSLCLMLLILALLSASKESMPDDVEGWKKKQYYEIQSNDN